MPTKDQNLLTMFHPGSVAVIGASKNPGKLGYAMMKSLTRGRFRGEIYPINLGEEELFGAKAYPSALDPPANIDVAIRVLPAEVWQLHFTGDRPV